VFTPVLGILSAIMVLAVVVMVVGAFAEGRGRHILRLAFGVRPRRDVDEVFAPVPRQESDWELVGDIDSTRDRPAPGDRAAAWARSSAAHAAEVVAERAAALRHSGEEAAQAAVEQPRTGELGLAQR